MNNRTQILPLLLFLAAYAFAAEPVTRADALFLAHQSCVYQIRVIDKSSGKKSSIGSGFSVSANGLFATNYHVVSDFVMEPGRYRLEYIAHDGATGPLRLLDIDVVHDLAIVASDSVRGRFFTLNETTLQKGSRIFSLGNPLDLGMTIIEGTYSGFIEGSLYEKIHFSGSLNPGMSGGPAIDAKGSCIGINVSTAGDEISFLVPARYLRMLIDTVTNRTARDTVNFARKIETQLFRNQQQYMGRLLAGEWKQDTLGRCLVPREMGNIFKCWGETQHDSDFLYTVSSVYCTNNDDIFLSSDLTTGSIEFTYHWYETSRLGGERFYRVLQGRFASTSVPNYGAEKDLDEPLCNTRFVSIAGQDWKTTMIAWRYKKYPSLNDVVLKMALVTKRSQCMIIELTLLGVGRETSLAFCRKFMGGLSWQN
jgi:hypothetical protein